MKTKLVLTITVVICIMGTLGLADSGVPQTPETQGFVTSTAIAALGTSTETDSIVWQNINNVFSDGLPVDPPLFYEATSLYTYSYLEGTIADQGLVTYTKGISLDTAGMAAENQYNVRTDKVVEFIGDDIGRMVSDESQLLDGAGTYVRTSEVFLCPFAQTQSYLLPSFCNIVEEGSTVDITIGSLVTGTEDRHVTPVAGQYGEKPGWDLPVSDYGTELNYDVRLTGFGSDPALGSATAYMNVHIQEGREGPNLIGNTVQGNGNGHADDPKAEDLVYSEMSTVTGDITLFQKTMNYHSKFSGGSGTSIIRL